MYENLIDELYKGWTIYWNGVNYTAALHPIYLYGNSVADCKSQIRDLVEGG